MRAARRRRARSRLARVGLQMVRVRVREANLTAERTAGPIRARTRTLDRGRLAAVVAKTLARAAVRARGTVPGSEHLPRAVSRRPWPAIRAGRAPDAWR